MISRRSRYGIVDFSEGDNDDNDSEKISYCKHCLEYGFMVPLKNRIYPDNEPIPVDHDQWRQCHKCGLMILVYELEKEASIKDVVETVDNPFDIGTSFLGIDSRLAKKRKRLRNKEKDFDYINDDDLKRELKKGSTLLSYSEQLP